MNYSANVKYRIKNTNVLGVRLSVPNGAYAVTVGAGGGRTMMVAAAERLIAGKLISEGDKTGAERSDSGDKLGIKEFA